MYYKKHIAVGPAFSYKKIRDYLRHGQRNTLQSNRYEPYDPAFTQVPPYLAFLSFDYGESTSFCSGTLVTQKNSNGEAQFSIVTAGHCLFYNGIPFAKVEVSLGQKSDFTFSYQYETTQGVTPSGYDPEQSEAATLDMGLIKYRGPADIPAAQLNLQGSSSISDKTLFLVSGFGATSYLKDGNCSIESSKKKSDKWPIGRTDMTVYCQNEQVFSDALISFSWSKIPAEGLPAFASTCGGDSGAFIGEWGTHTLYAVNRMGAFQEGSRVPIGFAGVSLASLKDWIVPTIESGNYTDIVPYTAQARTPNYRNQVFILAAVSGIVCVLGLRSWFRSLYAS